MPATAPAERPLPLLSLPSCCTAASVDAEADVVDEGGEYAVGVVAVAAEVGADVDVTFEVVAEAEADAEAAAADVSVMLK